MTRVLHDRYVLCGRDRGCDLMTGQEEALVALAAGNEVVDEQGLGALAELLEHGRDGTPRWIVVEAGNGAQVASWRRRAAAAARRRGYVPISLSMFERWRSFLEPDLRDRALLLVADGAERGRAVRAALLWACGVSPRPHVLLTFRTSAATVAPLVREARASYGAEPVPRPAPVVTTETARHLARAEKATEFMRAGRHAAAERLLKDVAGALQRRDAREPAARVLLNLAGILMERGRSADAIAHAGEAVRLADAAGAAMVAEDARAALAWATVDTGRLPDAESMLRAVRLTSGGGTAWTAVVLARCLFVQRRYQEAREVLDAMPSPPLKGLRAVIACDLHARLALASGDVFRAGQHVRHALDHAAAETDTLAAVVAHTARLRLLCASGDLAAAAGGLSQVLAFARSAHAPLRAVRARIVWAEALQRAGRGDEARKEWRRLQRLAPRCPALLRHALSAPLNDPSSQPVAESATGVVTALRDLVRTAQEREDDTEAMRALLQWASADLAASRAEFVSADGGAPAVLAASGNGRATTIAPRVLESGIPVGFDARSEEAAVPVRVGAQLLGALVCRWPVDRSTPARALDVLELTAAVIGPRAESLLLRSRREASAAISVPELIGASPVIEEVRRAIARAARAPFAVLIEGESGTGKELVARAIHQLGARRDRRFCDVNCAALPDDLFESELFGHARGAFTGAVADRPGLFEEANGGTLFLDEVAELSPRAQAKLLRVVQQQEVRRVGETFSRSVDVRLIAAANRDLQAEAADGRFRQDLLYRLNVIRIRMPPLRDRLTDVPLLAHHFWQRAAARVGSTAVLTPSVLGDLARYHWPGNVRELQNVIAALAVSAPSRGRVAGTLLPAIIGSATVVSSLRLAEARLQFDRRFIEAALARAGGSRTRAASALGVSRQGLLKLMTRLGIGGVQVEAHSATSGAE